MSPELADLLAHLERFRRRPDASAPPLQRVCGGSCQLAHAHVVLIAMAPGLDGRPWWLCRRCYFGAAPVAPAPTQPRRRRRRPQPVNPRGVTARKKGRS